MEEEESRSSLTDRGYGLVKSALAPGELSELREELTVAPFVPKDFAVISKPKPFPVFQESERKIYVPKCYGLRRFGLPSRVQVPEGAPIQVSFAGALRPGALRGARLWSKAGWTSQTRHDAAYVETAEGRRWIFVVFTVGHAHERDILPSLVRPFLR